MQQTVTWLPWKVESGNHRDFQPASDRLMEEHSVLGRKRGGDQREPYFRDQEETLCPHRAGCVGSQGQHCQKGLTHEGQFREQTGSQVRGWQ